ncbi:uncharacterized protein LOC144018802 isoform X2 [Festucalex cinctus]
MERPLQNCTCQISPDERKWNSHLRMMANKRPFIGLHKRYDPRHNSWCSIQPLQHQHADHCVCVVGDHIYAIGGRDDSKELCSVERYDPHSNTWEFVSPLPREQLHGTTNDNDNSALLTSAKGTLRVELNKSLTPLLMKKNHTRRVASRRVASRPVAWRRVASRGVAWRRVVPRSAGARHTLAHSYAHSCVSARSPAGSSRPATQDGGGRAHKRLFNPPRTTGGIKNPEKHNSVVSKTKLGVVRRAWGAAAEGQEPLLMDGRATDWKSRLRALCLKGRTFVLAYLTNGMQTRGRTMRRPFGVMRKLVGK